MSKVNYTKEEDNLIKKFYPTIGTNLYKQLNRSKKSLINRASIIKVRIKSKTRFCKSCSKELNPYPISKTGLCIKCSGKLNYLNRGCFTHHHGRLWDEQSLNILKDKYYNSPKEEICKLLNRSWPCIIHKAVRLKIKRNPKFSQINNFTSSKNPMNNSIIRNKVSKKLKNNYKIGKQKLSGVALKSSLGLTKKENHPNWLGGISFEPYGIEFNKILKEQIRKRDGCCMVCNISIEDLKLLKRQINVHHINYDKKLTIKENCLVLCNSCHMKTNYNRPHWIKFFQSLLNERYDYNYSENREVILNYEYNKN